MSILATTDTVVVAAPPRLRLVTTPEPTELDELMAEHGAWLRRLVRRRMADPTLVDDAVQETLLRVFRATPPPDPARVRPWLATIAKRTCADVWRAQAPPPASIDSERLPAAGAVVPGSDDHLVAVLERARINRALRQLPARHRRLLERQALFGQTYEEIADEDAVSVACVTSALGRARAGFRRRYAADDDIRSAPGWLAVLYRITDRLRARAQAVVGGYAVELAAASVTLGMAAVLVTAPASLSSEDVDRVRALASNAAPVVDGADPRDDARPPGTASDGAGPIAAGPGDAGGAPPPLPPSPPPDELSVGEVVADAPHVELSPEDWTVRYRVDVGAPGGPVSVRTEVELQCEGGRTMAAVCPVAEYLPGATSSS